VLRETVVVRDHEFTIESKDTTVAVRMRSDVRVTSKPSCDEGHGEAPGDLRAGDARRSDACNADRLLVSEQLNRSGCAMKMSTKREAYRFRDCRCAGLTIAICAIERTVLSSNDAYAIVDRSPFYTARDRPW
jgi:hypothetical protein